MADDLQNLMPIELRPVEDRLMICADFREKVQGVDDAQVMVMREAADTIEALRPLVAKLEAALRIFIDQGEASPNSHLPGAWVASIAREALGEARDG